MDYLKKVIEVQDDKYANLYVSKDYELEFTDVLKYLTLRDKALLQAVVDTVTSYKYEKPCCECSDVECAEHCEVSYNNALDDVMRSLKNVIKEIYENPFLKNEYGNRCTGNENRDR